MVYRIIEGELVPDLTALEHTEVTIDQERVQIQEYELCGPAVRGFNEKNEEVWIPLDMIPAPLLSSISEHITERYEATVRAVKEARVAILH